MVATAGVAAAQAIALAAAKAVDAAEAVDAVKAGAAVDTVATGTAAEDIDWLDKLFEAITTRLAFAALLGSAPGLFFALGLAALDPAVLVNVLFVYAASWMNISCLLIVSAIANCDVSRNYAGWTNRLARPQTVLTLGSLGGILVATGVGHARAAGLVSLRLLDLPGGIILVGFAVFAPYCCWAGLAALFARTWGRHPEW